MFFDIQHSAARSNAIAFFNDPGENIIRMQLPTNPSELISHIYFVILSQNTKKTIFSLLKEQTIPPFLNYLKVRKDKVYKALYYLVENNKYYNGVNIVNINLPNNGIPHELVAQLLKYLTPDIGEPVPDFNDDPRQSHIVNEIAESMEEFNSENGDETYVEAMIDFEKDPVLIQNIVKTSFQHLK